MVNFEKTFIINIKYKLTSKDYIIIDLKNKKQMGRYQTRRRPTQAYNKKIPIDKEKLKDWLSLCVIGLIPRTY